VTDDIQTTDACCAEGVQCSVPTNAIPTNAISTEIHVDRHAIMLYIHTHHRAAISCVMEYDFELDVKISVLAYSYG